MSWRAAGPGQRVPGAEGIAHEQRADAARRGARSGRGCGPGCGPRAVIRARRARRRRRRSRLPSPRCGRAPPSRAMCTRMRQVAARRRYGSERSGLASPVFSLGLLRVPSSSACTSTRAPPSRSSFAMPGVVRVGVGQHHRGHVGAVAAEGAQVVVEVLREARQAGVHGGQLVAVLDQVPVHVLGAEPVHPWSDLHGPLHPGCSTRLNMVVARDRRADRGHPALDRAASGVAPARGLGAGGGLLRGDSRGTTSCSWTRSRRRTRSPSGRSSIASWRTAAPDGWPF